MAVIRNIIAGGSPGIRVAILGDSMTAQSYAYADMWPAKFYTLLRNNGLACDVRAFAVNAFTFYDFNNTSVYGASTIVDAVIAYAPHVVLVVCGHNDAMNSGRSLAQINADALATFTTLRDALPGAEIYYGSQRAHDSANFTAATLKNKGFVPNYMERKSSGILAGLITPEMLDDDVSASRKTNYGNWESLDTYIKTTVTAAAALDGSFTIDAWKVARLGLLSSDGLHFNAAGHELLAVSALQNLIAISASFVDNVSDQTVPEWCDLDVIFDNFLSASGDGYVTSYSASSFDFVGVFGITRKISPDVWYDDYKGLFKFYPEELAVNSADVTGLFAWTLTGGTPNANVQLSINGGAFANSVRPGGEAVMTDNNGDGSDVSCTATAGFTVAATYTIRFKVGDSVFAPITVEVV